MITKQYFIYGRVQGVGCRYFTWREAEKIGICGTVQNREDGSVEVICQGSETQLAQFEQWLQQGPRMAKVAHMVSHILPPLNATGFSVIHD